MNRRFVDRGWIELALIQIGVKRRESGNCDPLHLDLPGWIAETADDYGNLIFRPSPDPLNRGRDLDLHRYRSTSIQLLGIGEDPIHGRYADPGAPCDLGALQAFSIELDYLGGLGACRGLPALVFPVQPSPWRHPSRCRSSRRPRSNSAMAASMVTISLPVGLRVSIL